MSVCNVLITLWFNFCHHHLVVFLKNGNYFYKFFSAETDKDSFWTTLSKLFEYKKFGNYVIKLPGAMKVMLKFHSSCVFFNDKTWKHR